MKILFPTLLAECFHNNQAFIKELPDGKITPFWKGFLAVNVEI